ncbi:MAG TPA: HD domain-containing protein [Chitinophagaceae bacterium]|nr:HD domain-containing protein [Chitinophagaceae bacterium]
MDPTLQQVRDFADAAHGEQMRKYSDDRYIVHPERVMQLCSKITNDAAVLSAALLHDVLEDTEVTAQELDEFLLTLLPPADAARTVQYVKELTDIYTKKNYPQWNRRKRRSKEAERLEKASPEAQTIKYADIIDNCPEIAREDPDFADRYISECRELLRKMTKGNEQLRLEAMDAVNRAKNPQGL